MWIDNGEDTIPNFPKYIEVVSVSESFILTTPIPELTVWVNELLKQKATEWLQRFIDTFNKS
ncbi:MAG: hypothetical protein IPN29_22045 [Saprospiraceae bacterium]|nr:hypothetical protein [Saprospiraceae bacterium]